MTTLAVVDGAAQPEPALSPLDVIALVQKEGALLLARGGEIRTVDASDQLRALITQHARQLAHHIKHGRDPRRWLCVACWQPIILCDDNRWTHPNCRPDSPPGYPATPTRTPLTLV